MKQLYQNKKALNFNGKSMYLKLFLDKKAKDDSLDLAFNQSLHEANKRAVMKGSNIYWEQLPSNIIS